MGNTGSEAKEASLEFEKAYDTGKKVYCKYCYKKVGVDLGEELWKCAECGYGLCPVVYEDTFED